MTDAEVILPTELWAMILVRTSDTSVLSARLLTLCLLTRSVFVSTWRSPSFCAEVLNRQGVITASDLDRLARASGTSEFAIADPGRIVRALYKIDSRFFTRNLIHEAVLSNLVNAVRVLTHWQIEDRESLPSSIIDARIVSLAMKESCFEIASLLVPGSAENPPPWLAVHAVRHALLDLQDLNVSSLSDLLMAQSISPPANSIVPRLLATAATRPDARFTSLVLAYASACESLYARVLSEAPEALLIACENGHIGSAKLLFELCHTVKPDTLRRCVLSQKVQLVQMLIEWYDACRTTPPSVVETADPFDPFTPLEEDHHRFLCGASRELWRRCVELSSRDGQLEILELLLVSPRDDAFESLDPLIPPSSLHLAILNRHTPILQLLLSKNVPVSRVAFATTISQDEDSILSLLLATHATPPAGAVSFSIDSHSFKCLKLLLASPACPVTATDVLFAAKSTLGTDDRRAFELVDPATGLVSERIPVLDLVMQSCTSAISTEAVNMSIHEGDPSVLARLLKAGAHVTDACFTSAVFLNNRAALLTLILHQQSLPALPETLATSTQLFQVSLTCAIETENVPLLAVVMGATKVSATASDLFIAARKNRRTITRFLIAENPGLAQTPLDLAVRQENWAVVETLVECGAVPGLCAVTAAVEKGNVRVLKMLLKGLKVGGFTEDQVSVMLGSAVCSGNDEIVQAVLVSGLCVPSSAHVYMAAKRGMVVSVKLMLATQRILARPSSSLSGSSTTEGQGPLDLAVREGSTLAIIVLLTAGVRVGPYALAAAVESGRVDLLVALVPSESSAAQGIHNDTPLFSDTESCVPSVVVALAIQNASVLMLKTLLKGFQVKISSVLLLMGVRRGRVETVRVLLEHYSGTIGKDVLDVAFGVDFEVAEALVQHVLGRK
ncbi:hypothetical protein HDU98_003659 [Podochytrium sp. JEL0797]|nr:hypothetical protein HDU98_003659 [Podochytrium sp. JEL0797]